MNSPINVVCVVGAGFMGSQIALQCAVFGKNVWMYDVDDAVHRKSQTAQARFMDAMITDGYVKPDRKQPILDRVLRTDCLEQAVREADLVIEAVPEDLSVKCDVFQQLDALCPEHTILASNSSSIRIARIESATRRTDRVLNTHFVQPIWKHPFVELMPGTQTTEDTLQSVHACMQEIGVIPVRVRKQSTGFIYNRIWRAVKKEALRVVDSGVATIEDVDRTWMMQMETSMGPFAMMDVVGLDVVRDIEMVYFQESGDPSDAPPKVLLDKITQGELGVKTGKGFYAYPHPEWESPQFLRPDST
ncbi:MAG: 3-hydroxyacyl-CoA dehydrogenase NAD-binding domain-containing protein [Planctomycetaceae bacterium]